MNATVLYLAGMTLVSVISVISPYVAGLSWVRNRPGFERFWLGAGLAAGRLKQLIPAGSTPAQAQALIETEAANVGLKYAASIKAAGLTPTQVVSTIEGLTKSTLPVGHILPAPVVTSAEDIVDQVIARMQKLQSAPVPAVLTLAQG